MNKKSYIVVCPGAGSYGRNLYIEYTDIMVAKHAAEDAFGYVWDPYEEKIIRDYRRRCL